ncbi:MAG: radical SAM protein [Candidatus Hodarchaeota archaeon]
MRRPYYKEPVFRPPSEARSLLIQATEGCTHKCTFCISNYGKKYLVRPTEEIKLDIDAAMGIYGNGVRRVFFLDGNAMSIPFKELHEITSYAFETFPRLERVGVYACSEDILAKSDKELKELRKVGLKIAYVGIETGDDEILKKINKKITHKEHVDAARKLMKAGITYSGTVILGIVGKDKELSKKHAINTAKLINEIVPEDNQTWYISFLTLMIPPGTMIRKALEEKRFEPMDQIEILEEARMIIENTDDSVHDLTFRSNHASNYLVLKGVLSDDKQKFLDLIDKALKDPSKFLRPEFYRAL